MNIQYSFVIFFSALFAPLLGDSDNRADAANSLLSRRQARQAVDSGDGTTEASPAPTASASHIITIRLTSVSSKVGYSDEGGNVEALKDQDIPLKIFGVGLTEASRLKLTTNRADPGEPCNSGNSAQSKEFELGEVAEDGTWATITIPGSEVHTLKDQKVEYFCLSEGEGQPFVHQVI